MTGGAGLVAAVVGTAFAVLPAAAPRSTTLVLGCSPGVGSHGTAVVSRGVLGVTVTVSNPTDQLLTVRAGSASVLAVPGDSQITLPVTESALTATCGSGTPVRLSVRDLNAANCLTVGSALTASVQRGQPADLTRAHLDAVPSDASIRTLGSGSVRRVQVRSGDSVVAEATWHAMPGVDEWHLDSLSRCDAVRPLPQQTV